MHFFSFTSALVNTARHILSRRKKEEEWATERLHQLEKQYGGHLDDFTFHKIVERYAIYILMICDPFAQLHGRNSNGAEKERMLYYFICGSLFDNFCDRKEMSRENLHQLSFQPQSYSCRNFDEYFFRESHLFLLSEVKDKTAYQQLTKQMYQAQMDSEKQFDPHITDEELKRITFHKGGCSVLLCRYYMDMEASQEEEDCWYRLGRIIQLTNDLFDIYKDLQDGTQTLAIRMKDAHAFNRYFLQLVSGIKEKIQAMPLPDHRKQPFLFSCMSICSFGATALHQLEAIQGNRLHLPPLQQLSRKMLITDMEKWQNRLYCIRFVYHQCR